MRFHRINSVEPSAEFSRAFELLQDTGIAEAALDFVEFKRPNYDLIDRNPLAILKAGQVALGEEPARAHLEFPDVTILLQEDWV